MWNFVFKILLPGLYRRLFSIKKPEQSNIKQNIEFPTAEEGRPFPVLFGMRRIKGINAVSPFLYRRRYMSDHHDVLATLYYIAVHLGVCQANIDGIKQIWFGDTCAWPTVKDSTDFASDSQTTALFTLANGAETMWGVWFDGGLGGVSGTIDIQYGGSSQTLNSYLSSKLGTNQPAYRGFVGLILKEPFYIGVTPVLRPVSIVGKRTDNLTDGTSMWYPSKSAINRGGDIYDLNAIHFIYEIMTSSIIGRGIDSSLIGTSFKEAADTCSDEGYGLSCVWDWAPDDIDKMIETVEKIVDGKLYYYELTEKYEFGLNRDDYNPDDLEIYNEDDFWVESAGFMSAGKIPNKTIILWEDRVHCQQRVAYDDDIAILSRQANMSNVSEKDYAGFVCDGNLANTIAARDQYVLTSMPKIFTLRCLRTMSHLHVTSVFKISYPELNIASMIVRVVSIDKGSLIDGEIVIKVVEDVFGLSYTSYGSPPAPAISPAELIVILTKDKFDLLTVSDYSNIYLSLFKIETDDDIGVEDYANLSIS